MARPQRTVHDFGNAAHWSAAADGSFFDNLAAIKRCVQQVNDLNAHKNIAVVLNEFRLNEGKITVSIIGPSSCQKEINEIKCTILKSYTKIKSSVIKLNTVNNRYCFHGNLISTNMLEFIQNVSIFNKCSIFIQSVDSTNYDIIVIGNIDQVSVTENKLKLFIDDSNPQNFSDFLELESLSLLPLLAGIKHSVLKKISNQTNCNIYIPNLLPSLYFNNSLENETGKPKIFITGLSSMVLLAKSLLQQVLSKVSIQPFIKQINVMPLKREMLSCFDYDSLNDLMYQTGCYLSLPSLGSDLNSLSTTSPTTSSSSSSPSSTPSPSPTTSSSSTNALAQQGDVITFQGNSIEDVEILIDQFMEKLSLIYSTKIDINVSGTFNDINNLLHLVDTLCFNSTSFITLNKFDDKLTLQILGDSNKTKIAINYLIQNLVDCKTTCIQYQIELLNKEKDFISGKKNGKIIKIINMSNSTIKLLPLNENNFIVELKCSDLNDSIMGLNLLEDELPKMLTFNVPESFHRQIIGVGGQTIQAIMRRFNVFVKFSNSFELTDKALDFDNILKSTNFQQSFIRKNNVVIKCPSKNKSQIPLAKIELEKLVERVTKNNYSCCSLIMNNQQWKLMTSIEFNSLFNVNRKKSTNFITELEKKTNTFIKYPSLESIENSQTDIRLEIFGIENNSKFCSNEMKKIIPYCYEFKLKSSPFFNELKNLSNLNLINIELSPIQLAFLNNLIIPLRMLFNIEVECFDNGQYQSFKVYYYPHSFGFNYIVNNANNDISSVERLTRDEESGIINNTNFVQVIQGFNNFLRDWQLELLESRIIESEVTIQEITTNVRSDEKKNVGSSSNNNTNTINNNNNSSNNKTRPATSSNVNMLKFNSNNNMKYSQPPLSRVGSNLNSSEETLTGVNDKSKIFSSISLPSKPTMNFNISQFQQPPQPHPFAHHSFNNQFGQPQSQPQHYGNMQPQHNSLLSNNSAATTAATTSNQMLPPSLSNVMQMNDFNFGNSDITSQFQSSSPLPSPFSYALNNNSNDKIWN